MCIFLSICSLLCAINVVMKGLEERRGKHRCDLQLYSSLLLQPDLHTAVLPNVNKKREIKFLKFVQRKDNFSETVNNLILNKNHAKNMGNFS